jgi:hypothetical protein
MIARRRRTPVGRRIGRPRPLGSHPQPRQAAAHGHCDEIALDFSEGASPRISPPDFRTHRSIRVPRGSSIGIRVAILFLVNVIDHLLARGHVRQVDGRWSSPDR